MARDGEEVQSRGRRGDGALRLPFVLPVRHHQNFVRYFVFRQKSNFQEVRSGDLHFFHFIQVRLSPIPTRPVGAIA